MRTFNAIFKSVYEKGLKEYGFIKLKSKQPYYVRLIGGEILHIITIREEWSFPKHMKEFTVVWGVATVYRKAFAFDENRRFNSEWLSDLRSICWREENCGLPKGALPHRFQCDTTDENSVTDAMEKSFELAEKYVLPVLDRIKTLEDCIEHYFEYHPNLLRIVASDAYVKNWQGGAHNEGLLSTIVYGSTRIQDYESIRRKTFEENSRRKLDAMMNGKSGITMEEYEKDKEERKEAMEKNINTFKQLVTEMEWIEKVRDELELRKKNNLELLEKYKAF